METFVVRVFVPDAGGDTPIAGIVEHVGTTWANRFTGEDELIASLRAWIGRNETPAPRSSYRHEEGDSR